MTRLTTSGMCKLTAIGVEKVGEKEEKPGEVPWLRGILGSPSRTRTYNLVVNSHPLCRLSYRGAEELIFLQGRITFFYHAGSRLSILSCGVFLQVPSIAWPTFG